MRCGLPGPVTRSFASIAVTISFAHIPAGLLYELGGFRSPYSVSLSPRYTTTLSRLPAHINHFPARIRGVPGLFRGGNSNVNPVKGPSIPRGRRGPVLRSKGSPQ